MLVNSIKILLYKWQNHRKFAIPLLFKIMKEEYAIGDLLSQLRVIDEENATICNAMPFVSFICSWMLYCFT